MIPLYIGAGALVPSIVAWWAISNLRAVKYRMRWLAADRDAFRQLAERYLSERRELEALKQGRDSLGRFVSKGVGE